MICASCRHLLVQKCRLTFYSGHWTGSTPVSIVIDNWALKLAIIHCWKWEISVFSVVKAFQQLTTLFCALALYAEDDNWKIKSLCTTNLPSNHMYKSYCEGLQEERSELMPESAVVLRLTEPEDAIEPKHGCPYESTCTFIKSKLIGSSNSYYLCAQPFLPHHCQQKQIDLVEWSVRWLIGSYIVYRRLCVLKVMNDQMVCFLPSFIIIKRFILLNRQFIYYLKIIAVKKRLGFLPP